MNFWVQHKNQRFGSGIANGLWLAFIGWFLNKAALQSYQKIAVQDVLEVGVLRRSDIVKWLQFQSDMRVE